MTAAEQPHVETDLDIHAITRDGRAHAQPIHEPAVIRWDPADPWAVTLDFTRWNRQWAIGWELLVQACGLHGRAGHGDVRIRRATPTTFELELSSPDGTALLHVDALDLCSFVQSVAPRQAAAAYQSSATATAELRAILDGDRS